MSTLVEPFFPAILSPAAAQLAPLASQHHKSEYNRLKFGLQGCPIKYRPLSIQLPDFFHELLQRQLQSRPWWFCHRSNPLTSPILLGPHGALPQDSNIQLQNEIQIAIDETLDITPCVHLIEKKLDPSIKTSLTHPINISSIIPPELITLISEHFPTFLHPSRPFPTVFQIPNSFSLDRLILSLCHPRNRMSTPPSPPKILVKHLRAQNNVTQALHAAISSGLATVNVCNDSNRKRRSDTLGLPLPTITSWPVPKDASTLENVPTTLHPNDSFVSLSLTLTSSDGSLSAKSNSAVPKPYMSSLDKTHIVQGPTTPVALDSLLPIAPRPPISLIGNLFLSSCPGKKVRLEGPVNGRNGVYRDLDTDLRRMKELGVGCIICCLDDGELDFLGAPWPEYEELSKKNAIDVLRIPTPEGLAPLAPADLDIHLTKVINLYTLRGIPVLVHCRGGVGRAGVIACCWLIRLGLCGWVEAEDGVASDTAKSPSRPGIPPTAPPATGKQTNRVVAGLRKDTVRFVEKIIKVVRQRRSMKAIETYEQVRFLVDFVEYLREIPEEA